MNRSIILLALLLSPWAQADVTLYGCQQGNQVILQDKPIEGCADQKTFTYQSFKAPSEDSSLRKQEQEQLKEPSELHKLQQSRYEHVDESVGNALMLREIDRRKDLCQVYKGRIEFTLIDIDRRPEDHYEVRQASRSLERDHAQYQYYCGQKYPQLDSYIYSLQTGAKPDKYRW